jgi:hypothetical protein
MVLCDEREIKALFLWTFSGMEERRIGVAMGWQWDREGQKPDQPPKAYWTGIYAVI